MTTQLPLLDGEVPMPSAPSVVLDDGTNCIPQHYLSYQHTLDSVANIVAEIDYHPNYILFVDEDNSSIFIQVGIIGLDNYTAVEQQSSQKIVYGRRWRVEPNLPSSEIIQTAFLALVKAREHEVRELFKWQHESRLTTPFSCHHDLPLMAMSRATKTAQFNTDNCDESEIRALLSKIRYDHAHFSLIETSALGASHFALMLAVHTSAQTSLPELYRESICIVCESLDKDAILYALMDKLLSLSLQDLEEGFTFKGYARFSRKNSIEKIAKLSAQTRQREITQQTQTGASGNFDDIFSNSNYETDESRVPRIQAGKLGAKISATLSQFTLGAGILPKRNSAQ